MQHCVDIFAHDEKLYKTSLWRMYNRQIWQVPNQLLFYVAEIKEKNVFSVSHNPFSFSILLKNFSFFPDFEYLTCFPL